MKPKRIVCLVADSLGIGASPDAAHFGDAGADTLGHTARAVGGLSLPNLESLGLGYLGQFKGIDRVESPKGIVGRISEKSQSKDTTTGHWEMAGVITKAPWPTFPQGFPSSLVADWVAACDLPGVLYNRPASGTVVIDEYGEEHLRTGKPILYTSGDSVFQVAAHEEVFGLPRLYEICEKARELTRELRIARVIARPFVGKMRGEFRRTSNRRDYSLTPPINLLDDLKSQGVDVYSVGKIEDIFDHRGICFNNHTGTNEDSLRATVDFLDKASKRPSFIFVNLVDFDMLYGHRRDPKGYAIALKELDQFLPNILRRLEPTDGFILTADHGCDPTFHGTDHTREFLPVVSYFPGKKGRVLDDREGLADIGATVADFFHVRRTFSEGRTFL